MTTSKSRFFNYPEPKQGPLIPYINERRQNPPMTGNLLRMGALALEWFGPLRSAIWSNGGFGILRNIREHIEDFEPRYDPTVVPRPGPLLDGGAESATEKPVLAHQPPKNGYYSAADYHALYLSGKITPMAVVRAILPLIRRDTTPPGEHSLAWFDTKVDAVLQAAEESTLRYREGRPLGPLDGVPTAVKDEYAVEGYRTCLGSRNDYTDEAKEGDKIVTSWTVQQLEEAGAIVMGKLSMHEFGLDTSGNNPIYGTPRNPYNHQYYTGGSSSGSAYAVSCGLVPFALGSDGGGSIRLPASFCGVFGLKPSHGRVSFRPGPNHSVTCAVNGPLAADIRSLAAAFELVATPDPVSDFPQLPPLPRLLGGSQTDAKAYPKVLGVPETWISRAAPGVQELCRKLIARMVDERGYKTVPIEIPFLVEGQIAHSLVVLTDAATLLPETSNLTHGNRILLALGRTTPSTDYLLAQKLRGLLMSHLAHLWREHPGMVIVTPTASCAGWPIRSSNELTHGVSDADRTIQTMEYVWLANFCGTPALTVPAGYVVPERREGAGTVAGPDVVGGVPVGLMMMGEWASELDLLRVGVDAEALGADSRTRPPVWVDVVARAREEMNGAGGVARAREGDVLIDL